MEPTEVIYSRGLRLQDPMKAAMARGDSQIQAWYKGSTALVTGGSGYLGKLLVEKLVRSCKMKKILVLIRVKKGKSMKDRLDALLQDPLFDVVREQQPFFSNLIQGIEGDVADLRLGISPANWKTLTEEVDIIFHLAATTRFDEQLKLATLINVRGTREVLDLAKDCRKLRSFVHISTAFTHATHDKIDGEILEQFYPSPVGPDALIHLAETTSEERLCAITKDFILGWPNTYAFTKAVSEELVRASAMELPICVFRPSIVFCPYYEPEPGYVDISCAYGTTGIVLGVAMGIMRVLYTRREVRLSYVPADFTTNAAIACGWDIARRRAQGDVDVRIYTLSNSRCNVGFYSISDLYNTKGPDIPTPKSIWYNYLVETDNRLLFKIYTYLLHYIPAYIVDAVIYVFNIKMPQGFKSFVKLYTKIDKMTSVYSYFLTKEWFMRDDNMAALYHSLTPTDKDLFCFDIMTVDWDQLFLLWALGIRKYLIKDDMKGSLYGKKKQRLFRIANYGVLLLYIFVLWMIFMFVFRLLVCIFGN